MVRAASETTLFAVLTMADNLPRHATIAATWGALIPRDHLVLYTDGSPSANAGLTFVAHAASQVLVPTPPSPSTGPKYMVAQDRFTYLVLPDAVARMRALGAKWLYLGDDDTFVWPENLSALLRGCDPSEWHWLGQGSARNAMFAGGAGFVASRAFAIAAAAVVANCTDVAPMYHPYDARLGSCFALHLGARITDAKEFNSQSPPFYATSQGRLDRPAGIGRAVTFHYLKGGTIRKAREGERPFAPDEFFRGLWMVTRAAEPTTAANGARQCRHQPMSINGDMQAAHRKALARQRELLAARLAAAGARTRRVAAAVALHRDRRAEARNRTIRTGWVPPWRMGPTREPSKRLGAFSLAHTQAGGARVQRRAARR